MIILVYLEPTHSFSFYPSFLNSFLFFLYFSVFVPHFSFSPSRSGSIFLWDLTWSQEKVYGWLKIKMCLDKISIFKNPRKKTFEKALILSYNRRWARSLDLIISYFSTLQFLSSSWIYIQGRNYTYITMFERGGERVVKRGGALWECLKFQFSKAN